MCKKLIYLVCYVLLLGLVLPSLASGGILYETSFDTADAVADWQVVSGTWQLDTVAGTYISSGSGNEALINLYQGRLSGGGKASDLVDYTLVADMESVGSGSGMCLCARYQDTSNYRDTSNYYIYRYHFGLEELEIFRIASVNQAKIASEPFLAADLPEIYTLILEVEGTTLTGRLLDNGAELASVTVEDDTFASGPGGLRSKGPAQTHHYFAFGKGPFWLWFLCARLPNPADGAVDVPRDVVLSWEPGEFAAQTNGHKVYFGESFDDVNDATGVVAQTATSYAPAQRLDFGTTYYWRVDEVNAPPTSHVEFKGEVWSFTTEPVAYPIAGELITATASSSNSAEEGPANTINGSGLDVNDLDLHSTELTDMWLSGDSEPNQAWVQLDLDQVTKLSGMRVWNHNSELESVVGYGIKEALIEYSLDGIAWSEIGIVELAQAPGSADYQGVEISLDGIVAQSVKITANNNWSVLGIKQYGLSEVRFLYIPLRAREPQPESGATDVDVDVTLSWKAGREAAEHDVYLSSDEQAVIDSNVPVSIVTEAQDGPLSLDLAQTYYWKVNEVNTAVIPSAWEGDIWSFTTQEFFPVDDFEDYNDYPPDEIWSTWIDGYGAPTNGSTVGYPDPDFLAGEHYAETTIVHGGEQAMPFFYDNTETARYSQARRTFASPQDWAAHGADTLLLYLRGYPTAFFEHADGSISMSGFGTNIWGEADGFRFAYKSLGGDGSIVARVDSIVDTHVSAKACVMIRKTLEAGSPYAALCLTPRKGILFTLRLRTDVAAVWGDPDSPNASTPLGKEIQAPYWIKLERSGDQFSAFYSADGIAWEPTYGTPQTIPMEGNLLIGLGVTSRSADVPTFVEFSNVTTTGAVTGQWQVQAVGAEQPSNDPAPLYVTLEDSMGRAATVPHPDELAITNIDWEPWPVPLGDFIAAGVDVSDITTMAIGVGDPENPPTGDTGLIYIDDIQWGRPAPDQGQ